MAYISKLKEYIDSQKDEITQELLDNKDTLDDISKEHLTARYQCLCDIENICEQRGRY